MTDDSDLLAVVSSDGNFTDLNKEISESQNEFKLTRDYVYDAECDGNFTRGIAIHKNNFLLDGSGHSIDGKNKASIFDIKGNNITIKNLIIKNANDGALIFSEANEAYLIDNITIQNCSSNLTSYGGIFLEKADLILSNSKFISNTGTDSSDIMIVEKASASISNSIFEGGNATKWAHIYCTGGLLSVENSTFANSRSNYSNAIYGEGSVVTVRNSKFKKLIVLQSAGAITIRRAANLTVEGCEFEDITSAKDAGAIFADIDGYVTIANSKFNDCFAQFGGALMQLGGNLNISNSTFNNNRAIFDGGVIWTSYADVFIEDSKFRNNSVIKEDLEIGGVLYFDKGYISISGSTFIDNHGSNKGDAVFTYDAELTLKNNTFKDNGNALYAVYGTNNIAEDNLFNDDFISVNNTYYSTVIVNKGVEIKINKTSIKFDTLPEKFNLKDYGLIGPVKDQGNMGACWTFGTSSSLQSALLKATGILYDFSEDNIQNTMLQYSLYGVDGIVEGAIQNTAVAYLVNWYGPYPTYLDHYDELGKVSTHLNLENESIHVQDAVFIPARHNATDNDILKRALVDYGAFLVAIYSEEMSTYLNRETSARYYNGTKAPDHAVTLVGWDDNYSAGNFLNAPPGDGAWIIKNSWGESWGDGGYFYLSYYDTSFFEQYQYFAAYLFDNTVPYNKNYQTDAGQLYGFNTDIKYYSNTYTAIEDDLIAAVGTYFNAEGVEYEFDIYVNGALKHTQRGSSPFFGYHTIKLNEYIPISANDTFKVVFKNNPIPLVLNSRHHPMENVSFASGDGVIWEDIAGDNAMQVLKVYTVNASADSPKPVISANKDITMLYSAGTSYKVRLTADGGALIGKYVTFKFNGVTKKVKTDSKGYATYKIPNVKPKSSKYTITAAYNGVTVKNKVKVNGIVVAKNLKAKKSAKLLKIKVTLKKVNKKYLKGKKVTLKFKGKTYKVKTDKKGVATFKINKNVLKKLKVGKKYTYKVTYGKNIVSKKITVKR